MPQSILSGQKPSQRTGSLMPSLNGVFGIPPKKFPSAVFSLFDFSESDLIELLCRNAHADGYTDEGINEEVSEDAV